MFFQPPKKSFLPKFLKYNGDVILSCRHDTLGIFQNKLIHKLGEGRYFVHLNFDPRWGIEKCEIFSKLKYP